MTPEQQKAYELRKQGMSRKDIAQELGVSESAVKHRLERARKWLNADPAAKQAATVAGSNAIPHSFWIKSDTHSVYYQTPKDDAKADMLTDIADAFKDVPAVVVPKPVNVDGDHITVYPLYDMHIGMMAWGRETRGQDFDLGLMKTDLMHSIAKVMARSPDSGEALIILGGDTIHVNDHFNETPASGHHQDADGRFEKIVDVAIEAISEAIEIISQKHGSVKIVVLRGNHDETSHIVLKAALKQRYRITSHIDFPTVPIWDKSEIFWFTFGNVLIVAHHGDKMKPERLAMIAADKCPDWSGKTCRVLLTGHIHTFKVMDMPGATHYSLRAFCPPDAYGSNFGGVRGLAAMTFDRTDGLVVSAHDPINRG